MELVTQAEKDALQAKLAALVANRGKLSQRISEARDLGDLKENGDYHAAREQQGMEEADIRRLEQRLANMSVIDEAMAKAVEGVIFIGSTFKLRDESDGDVDTYKLVGESSGSPSADLVEVTATSPMGEALLKAKLNDVVRVNAPRGLKMFRVVEIL